MTTDASDKPLTEAKIRKALDEAPANGEFKLYDPGQPGLVLWRRGKGKPRWYLFTRAGGAFHKVPVGDMCDLDRVPLGMARDLAKVLIGRLAAGSDVEGERRKKREKARQAKSGGVAPLADALKLHLRKLDERQRDARHTAELGRVVKDAITHGVVDLAEPGIVKRARSWLEDLDLAEQTRGRYRRHLLAVTRTALAEWPPEILARDPFVGLRGKGAAMPVPAVFTPNEAMTLCSDKALALEGGRLWCLLVYSGCRYREAAWARWDRINLERMTFDVVPPSASEHAAGYRVKRNKPRTVALPAELVALLRQWKEDAGEAPFIISDEKWRKRMHWDNTEAFRAHLTALDIPLADSEGKGRKIHSLRHTRQTLGIACGEDSLRLRLSMGHAGEDMGAHYSRLAMRFRSLLADWEGVLKLRDQHEVERVAKATVSDAQHHAPTGT
jgi:integrase